MHACAVEMAAQQAQGQPLGEAGAQPGAQGPQHGQVCFFMTFISTMCCTLCLQERLNLHTVPSTGSAVAATPIMYLRLLADALGRVTCMSNIC